MGYYIRVLSTAETPVPLETLRAALRAERLDATLETDEPKAEAWSSLVLASAAGAEWAEVERNAVTPGSLGEGELAELAEEAENGIPETGGAWVKAFLDGVRTIYAIQIFNAGDSKAAWAAIGAVKNALRNAAESIVQADGEGFSNTEGYHVLWQFSPSAKGTWHMAVLDEDGKWRRFAMDLGNKAHRAAFQAGRVPDGVEVVG